MKKEINDNNRRTALFALSLCLIGIVNILITKRLFFQDSDFYEHMLAAENFFNGTEGSVYPVYYFLYGFFSRILNMGQLASVIYAQTFFSCMTAIVTYGIARYYLSQWDISAHGWDSLIMLFMSFFGPLYSVAYNRGSYLLGQGGYNSWHNPTNNAVKAMGLLTLFLFSERWSEGYWEAEDCIRKKSLKSKEVMAVSGLLCLVSVFCKPSFVQSFLPAVLLTLFWNFMTGQRKFLQCVRYGVFYIPAGLIIIWQYYIAMYTGTGEGVEIAPFEVWNNFSENIIISIILGIAFPIFCILFCRNVGGRTKKHRILSIENEYTAVCYLNGGIYFSGRKG